MHVAARVAQVDEVIERASAARAPVQAAHDALAARVAGRLWLPAEASERWLAAHRHTLAALDAQLARLQAIRAGFASLPVDARAEAIAPPPVALAAPSAVHATAAA